MNILMLVSQITSQDTDLAMQLGQSYIFLTVAIPIMIAILCITTFLMMFGIWGLSDRLDVIRRLLEDVFEEKLNAIDKADQERASSEKAAREATRLERLKSMKPPTKKHRIVMGILAGSIPVLLIILLTLTNLY